MTERIHSTAIIDAKAQLADTVKVGPFTVIGPDVVLEDDVEVMSHCFISGFTTIGARTKIFPGAVIGTPPQDKKYKPGDDVVLEIGTDNIFREHVMINPGTVDGGGKTVIGNSNLFMAYAHVAHDCRIGNRCVLANVATVAGHVVIEDSVVLGGLSGVHQFVRIGRFAMVGGCSRVNQDVVPYAMCSEADTRVFGVNLVGLRRAGFSADRIQNIKRAFKLLLFSGLSRPHALERIEAELIGDEAVGHLVQFVKSSQRGIMGGKQ